MKKTILAALIVLLVSTPSFTQQIDTEEISSLHGTVWQESLRIPIIPGGYYHDLIKRYFYGGRVYGEGGNYMGSYVDLLAFSFSFDFEGVAYYEIGIWLPAVDLGMSIQGGLFHGILPFLGILIYNKIKDNWIPEETINYIRPIYGAQGTTLIGVELSSSYTTFKENPSVEIIFDPPEGLTVSHIDVANDGWMFFDLEIAVDAPVGKKRVIAIYDEGRKVVESSDVVFTVIPPGPTPSGEILSISPNQGEQGTTLTDVTIMGADTTFKDIGVSAILLMPPGGFTVSNINAISNTQIEFDLEIAGDAPVGSKIVIVEYYYGCNIYNSEVVFEITGKTNQNLP